MVNSKHRVSVFAYNGTAVARFKVTALCTLYSEELQCENKLF